MIRGDDQTANNRMMETAVYAAAAGYELKGFEIVQDSDGRFPTYSP